MSFVRTAAMLAAVLSISAARAEDVQDKIVASILGNSANKVAVVGPTVFPEQSFQDRLGSAVSHTYTPEQDPQRSSRSAAPHLQAGSDLQGRLSASITGRR